MLIFYCVMLNFQGVNSWVSKLRFQLLLHKLYHIATQQLLWKGCLWGGLQTPSSNQRTGRPHVVCAYIIFCISIHTPSLKLMQSIKTNGWKTTFLLGCHVFKCYVSFSEGVYIYIYLDPPRGAKWMVKGATKQPLRVQTPPLGGCWYVCQLYTVSKLSCIKVIHIQEVSRKACCHSKGLGECWSLQKVVFENITVQWVILWHLPKTMR